MPVKMAPCWNCGYPVDFRIKKCPYCGVQLKRSKLLILLVAAGILALLWLIVHLVA